MVLFTIFVTSSVVNGLGVFCGGGGDCVGGGRSRPSGHGGWSRGTANTRRFFHASLAKKAIGGSRSSETCSTCGRHAVTLYDGVIEFRNTDSQQL